MGKRIKMGLLGLTAFLCYSGKSVAQSGPVVCSINYDYDVAGNRIKREYKCEATWMPWDNAPWQDHSVFTTLYPNPTTGVITGVFSSPIGGAAGPATLTLNTMGGITIFQQVYSQPMSSVSLDLSQQIPGQYLLTVMALNMVESYTITKL